MRVQKKRKKRLKRRNHNNSAQSKRYVKTCFISPQKVEPNGHYSALRNVYTQTVQVPLRKAYEIPNLL